MDAATPVARKIAAPLNNHIEHLESSDGSSNIDTSRENILDLTLIEQKQPEKRIKLRDMCPVTSAFSQRVVPDSQTTSSYLHRCIRMTCPTLIKVTLMNTVLRLLLTSDKHQAPYWSTSPQITSCVTSCVTQMLLHQENTGEQVHPMSAGHAHDLSNVSAKELK